MRRFSTLFRLALDAFTAGCVELGFACTPKNGKTAAKATIYLCPPSQLFTLFVREFLVEICRSIWAVRHAGS